MPLVIASLAAACDDKQARNESNDLLTLTPKINLLRWKNHGDASSSLAVGSPALNFDVEYQRKSHYLRWSNRAKRYSSFAKSLPHFHATVACRAKKFLARI